MPSGINIKFPFEETTDGGVFATNKTTTDAIRDDLVALLTLRRGQRPMEGNMYSPVYDYIFEQLDEIMEAELRRDMEKKIAEYIPQVSIKKMKFTPYPEQNLLEIKIVFTVEGTFGIEQTVNISIPTEAGNGTQ